MDVPALGLQHGVVDLDRKQRRHLVRRHRRLFGVMRQRPLPRLPQRRRSRQVVGIEVATAVRQQPFFHGHPARLGQ